MWSHWSTTHLFMKPCHEPTHGWSCRFEHFANLVDRKGTSIFSDRNLGYNQSGDAKQQDTLEELGDVRCWQWNERCKCIVKSKPTSLGEDKRNMRKHLTLSKLCAVSWLKPRSIAPHCYCWGLSVDPVATQLVLTSMKLFLWVSPTSRTLDSVASWSV